MRFHPFFAIVFSTAEHGHMSVAAWVEVKYDGNVVKSYNKKVRSKRRLLFYVKK